MPSLPPQHQSDRFIKAHPGHFATLIETARSGAIEPVIAARFPLYEIATAQEYFSRDEYVGKIVVNVG